METNWSRGYNYVMQHEGINLVKGHNQNRFST